MRFLLKKYSSYNPFFSIGRKYFVCNYRIYTAKKFSKIVNPWLAAHSFDVIVAPASTTEIAYVNTDLPIVLVDYVMTVARPAWSNAIEIVRKGNAWMERLYGLVAALPKLTIGEPPEVMTPALRSA